MSLPIGLTHDGDVTTNNGSGDETKDVKPPAQAPAEKPSGEAPIRGIIGSR